MARASFLASTEILSTKILHQSIVNRDSETIKRILKEQQSWKVKNNDGETVLHLAFKCKNNILSHQDSIIQTLECFLNVGLSVDIINAAGCTILFLAVENRLRLVLDFLVKRGANVNTRDKNGNSIIHLLIEDQFKKYYESCMMNGGFNSRQLLEQQDVDFMYWVISRRVDVDIQNKSKKTAFSLAMERNLQHVMPILIKSMKIVYYIDDKKRTILESIFRARTKLNARRVALRSCIYDYCYDSKYDAAIIRVFLDKGVSVDHINNRGNTLVHQFLKSFDTNPEMIGRMVERYKNVNTQDRNGNTALHLIIRNDLDHCKGLSIERTVDVVRTLIMKGANVHLKNNFGETIVRQAFRIKHAVVLKYLLKYNADVSPTTNPGTLFLHDICDVPSIEDEVWAPIVDTLVQAGWNVNEVRPGDQFNPLMEACRSTCPKIAQKLIDNGANVNYVEKYNLLRPIHVAAMNCHPDRQVKSAALFKILAGAGAKINVKNRDGKTAIHLTPICGYSNMLELLTLHIHVDARDNAGRLPLHEAVKKKDIGAIKALLQYGADVSDEGVLIELNKFGVIRSQVTDHLIQHWLKLKAANLPVIDGFANFAKKRSLQAFYVECLKEVETLKTYHLNERTTIYDLLHKNVCFKYVFMTKNERLKKIVKSPLLEKTFPKYHVLLLAYYNKAVVRYRLMITAKQAWDNLTGIRLPDCLERILAYLENDDLSVMAEEEDVVNFETAITADVG